MKKLRLSLYGVFAILCVNSFAQNSDIGYDWDTSQEDPNKLVPATSNVPFIEDQLSYTVNFGLDYQINFEIGGSGLSRTPSHNAVYISNVASYPSSTAFSYVQLGNGINSAYFEGYVASDKKITALKLNGATASTSNGTEGGILFSDVTPFDASKVIGYTNVSFPACRAGGDGVNLNEATIPAGTKSFRLYGRAQIVPTATDGYYEVKDSEVIEGEPVTPEGAIVVGTGASSVRLAYANATISASTLSIGSVNAGDKVLISKYYYDLAGFLIPETAAKGIVISKSVFEDGTISYDKLYINK